MRNSGSTKQTEYNKMAIISPYLSIITLHVNTLNSSIKRQDVWMDKNQNSSICCLHEIHFSLEDTETGISNMSFQLRKTSLMAVLNLFVYGTSLLLVPTLQRKKNSMIIKNYREAN